MTPAHLQQWIQHPETLNRETLYELRTLVARYPYFQTLRLLYLKNLYLLHDITFGAELRKAALYVADRRALFYLIEGDRFALRTHLPEQISTKDLEDEPSLDRTLSLIDAFLTTIPDEHSQQTELDYAMDYTSYLTQENDDTDVQDAQPIGNDTKTPKLRGQDLIDGFIRRSKTEEGVGVKLSQEDKLFLLEVAVADESEEMSTPMMQDQSEETSVIGADELDDSCFTETLAKIYIKQRRYSKALEIIKKLSLNYPKKNAYFADQIRFLEKLIINAKSK